MAKKYLMIIIFCVCFDVVSFPIPSAQAASKASEVKEGNKLYGKQDFDKALEKYNSALAKDPNSDIINFNAGTALYKKGDYKTALSHFQTSLLSEDPKIQAKSHYNLGNIFYKLGIPYEKKQPQLAKESLQQALDHYKKASTLDPEDEDAKANAKLVEERLAELKKYESQAQNQDKKDSSQSQDDKNSSKDADKGVNKEEDQQWEGGQKDAYQKGAQGDQNLMEKSDSGQDQMQDEKGKESESGKDDQKDGAREGDEQKDDQKDAKKIMKQDQSGKSDNKTEDKDGQKEFLNEQMSQQEALRRLEQYGQSEEPKGLLNMQIKGQGEDKPVSKDW